MDLRLEIKRRRAIGGRERGEGRKRERDKEGEDADSSRCLKIRLKIAFTGAAREWRIDGIL